MKNEAKNNGQGVAGTTGTARTIGALLRSGALLLLLLVAGCGEVEWFPDYERSATTPDDFSFEAKKNTEKGATVTSDPITVAGLTGETAPISITDHTVGSNSKYTIGGGTPTNAAGTVKNGDTVTVTHTAANSLGTPTESMLTIGSGSGSLSKPFRSTTVWLEAPSFNQLRSFPEGGKTYRWGYANITSVDTGVGNHVITLTNSSGVPEPEGQYAVTGDTGPNTNDWKSSGGTLPVPILNGRRLYVRIVAPSAADPVTTTLNINGKAYPVTFTAP